MEINILSEFERYGIQFEYASNEEVKTKCPFHDDNSPSCFVNVVKNVFKCQTAECAKQGDTITLLARIGRTSRAVMIAELSKRYDLENDKLVDAQLVEKYHSQIFNAGPLLQALYARGLTDDDLRKYRIGEYDGRITIPIKNRSGNFVNLRKYLPGAPGAEKMKNLKGHSAIRLFPIEQLEYDNLIICGGECKAIVAARQLNPYGIGAITATAGEGNFPPELVKQIAGKNKLWICLDIDKSGQVAAEQICLQVRTVAQWVANIVLPLDKDKYPKGDINDYVGQENGELLPLLQAAEEFAPKTSLVDYGTDAEAEELELVAAINAGKANKRICVKSIVAAMDTSPYIIPKDIEVICKKDEKICTVCPVFLNNNSKFSIPAESPAILEMVAAHKSNQLEVIKLAVGIPQSCRACQFAPVTHYNVEDARISPQLEITNRSADRVQQAALCIGEGLELNESYKLTGRMFPHPKTQQAVLLISGYNPTQDALSTYQCNDAQELGIFWPAELTIEGLQAKLDEIYLDFEANVTGILQRQALHLVADLAYHSPLFFTFDNRTVKGWVEVLIMGDSSQGKSEVVCGSSGSGGLMAHYKLGEKVECKNASVAGLLGGLQKMGERWFVSWGVIPTHDKRLVILEELKGANTDVIGKLTDMRSSGIAEIPKIEKRRTHARTRLIAISNCRSQLTLSQYSFGIQAVKELIGGLEDVRRFDMVLLLSQKDVDSAVINAPRDKSRTVPHVYTSELCRKLVLWGWTRTKEQIIFAEGTEATVLEKANELCNKYTDAIPIVDRGSMRYKLARLSASLAARTFSCSDDYESLIVYPCHVEYIAKFLDTLYSSSTFGYADYTQALAITNTLENPDEIGAALSATPYPKDLCKSLLAATKIEIQDLQDWCAWDRMQAQVLLSFLVRKHALMRDGRAYRKTAPFIEVLKTLLETVQDVPKYIKDNPLSTGEF